MFFCLQVQMSQQFTFFDVNCTQFLIKMAMETNIPISVFNKYNVNRKLHHQLGWTLAHVIAVRGCWKSINGLMDIGMNPDQRDNNGMTARQISEDIHGVDIFSGETCKYVIPNSNDLGITSTHILAISGKPLPLYDLVKKGDRFDQIDSFGNTPLDYLEWFHGDGNLYKRLIWIFNEIYET